VPGRQRHQRPAVDALRQQPGDHGGDGCSITPRRLEDTLRA
jgi:hypothetical protein